MRELRKKSKDGCLILPRPRTDAPATVTNPRSVSDGNPSRAKYNPHPFIINTSLSRTLGYPTNHEAGPGAKLPSSSEFCGQSDKGRIPTKKEQNPEERRKDERKFSE
ncbi:hypothetical protein LY78DRAFT_665904 [Colletotrichum sublineola]|nr:hypothetical protein LY78DRAFT_665904 [Colletotrichum sublineola]